MTAYPPTAAESLTIDRNARLLAEAAELPTCVRIRVLGGIAAGLRVLLRRAEQLLREAQEEIEPLTWADIERKPVLVFHPEPGRTSYGRVTGFDADAKTFTLDVPGDGVFTYLFTHSLTPYSFRVDEEATAAALVCPLCRGNGSATAVSAVNADGSLEGATPGEGCMVCDGAGEVRL